MYPEIGEKIYSWRHPNKDVYQTLTIYKRKNGLFKYDVWDSRTEMVTCYEYQIPCIIGMMRNTFYWDWENQVKFKHKSNIYKKVWMEGYEEGFKDGQPKTKYRKEEDGWATPAEEYKYRPSDWDYGLED